MVLGCLGPRLARFASDPGRGCVTNACRNFGQGRIGFDHRLRCGDRDQDPCIPPRLPRFLCERAELVGPRLGYRIIYHPNPIHTQFDSISMVDRLSTGPVLSCYSGNPPHEALTGELSMHKIGYFAHR